MKKRWSNAALGLVLALALLVSTVGVAAFAVQTHTGASAQASADYEIYPIPHSMVYQDGSFELTDIVNVVYGEGLDGATKNRLNEAFANQDVHLTESAAPVEGRTNVLLGVKGAGSAAEEYVEGRHLAEDGFFDRIDAHILTADSGAIAVLGRDTDAVFAGATTLKLILDQTETREIRNFVDQDYADAEYRGFIEGYYGLPWSNEDRKSLMDFGGDFKMNTYVFAPKDDPYHNAQWRVQYPKDKLEEIRDMVQTGINSKCRFVWSIHPFMSSGMRFDGNYAADLAIIEAKFQQLYNVGVRQFGVLADDAGSISAANIIRLMTDLDQWVKEHEGTYDLLFCPPGYNRSWASTTELRAWQNMPEDVQIFWTGDGVCGWVTQSTFDYFKNYAGREPLMWLNWPVNDINGNRLLMGPGEVLGKDVSGFTGIVSNPMQQAQCSKTALFAVADYTWNQGAFNKDKSWADSFRYIEPDAAEELHTMAKHLQDPDPNSHGLVLPESVELNPKLEEFKTKYAVGQSIKETGTELVSEFEAIVRATEGFAEKSQNENLKTQIDPWRRSLQALSKANIELLKTAIALEEHDNDALWAHYSEGTAQLALSKTFPVKNKNSVELVEAGSKRLIPFAAYLSERLADPVKAVVAPDETAPKKGSLYTNFTANEVYGGALNNVIDDDDGTHVWINRYIRSGDYIGLQFSEPVQISGVKVVQGTNDKPQDAFYYGKFQISQDGQSWTDLNNGQTYGPYQANIQVNNLDVTAKYVRFIVDGQLKADGEANPKWPAFRTFAVTQKDNSSSVYTNVEALKDTSVSFTSDTATIDAISSDVTLAKGEYIGVKMPRIRDLTAIAVDAAGADKLALETSVNAAEWSAADPANPQPARYVRLINRGNEAVTFQLNGLIATSHELAPISLAANTIGSLSGAAGNLFDGDWTTQTQFQGSQANGRYFVYDLGQTIHLDSIKFVLSDGEWDFPRNADVYVSMDNQNWDKIFTIGNGETDVELGDVFPVHEVSYNTLTQRGIDKDARYLKMTLTSGPGPSDKWVRFNEIILNDGAYIPQENNPTFESIPQEKQGHAASNLTDGNLSTTYLPDDTLADGGVLTYRLSESTDLKQLIILQSAGTVSNAMVSVRPLGADAFTVVGRLDKSFNAFDDLPNGVAEVRIAWNGVAPELHEIVTLAK